MQIVEKKTKKTKFVLRMLFPVLILGLLCYALVFGISQVSEQTLGQEQATLAQALRSGAVHAYALTGQYPESLSELLETYHITYNTDKFIVEYVPNGANLFPMISVLPRTSSKGGKS
jgi:type II secretory pathway pseudopilin PulG